MTDYSLFPLCNPILLVEIFVPVLSILLAITLIEVAILILMFYLLYRKKKLDFRKHLFDTFSKEMIAKPKEVAAEKTGGWTQVTATSTQNTVDINVEKEKILESEVKPEDIVDTGVIDWLPEKPAEEIQLPIEEPIITIATTKPTTTTTKPEGSADTKKNRLIFEKMAEDNKKLKVAAESNLISSEEKQKQKQVQINPYAKICPSCKKEIIVGDAFAEVEDKVFHESCFKCSKCENVIDGPYIKKKKIS